MFGGSFTHSLDSAGRFIMPMGMRLSLGEKFVISKGVGCLCVFPEDVARDLEDELNKLGNTLALLLNPDISRLHRHFFSGMVTTSTDKQFRVQLTAEHRRYAEIEEDVVICGCGKYIELWSPKKLDEYNKKNDSVNDLVGAGNALLGMSFRQNAGDVDAGLSSTGID